MVDEWCECYLDYVDYEDCGECGGWCEVELFYVVGWYE